ncbi:hypothetical protein BT93_G0722 [Corymbia citriodora subsp. variegata]|nr:hypothetical protein BT93_G0722 [Corymbia citriodora subsp. variegata]
MPSSLGYNPPHKDSSSKFSAANTVPGVRRDQTLDHHNHLRFSCQSTRTTKRFFLQILCCKRGSASHPLARRSTTLQLPEPPLLLISLARLHEPPLFGSIPHPSLALSLAFNSHLSAGFPPLPLSPSAQLSSVSPVSRNHPAILHLYPGKYS